MATRLAIALFALWLVTSFVTVPIARADEAAAPVDSEEINAFVEDLMEKSSIPGVALTIVKNGRIVHSEGYGHTSDDGQAVTPQTPFILGSTSKSITALAVMQLVDRGAVELDAPVQRYIPWFTLADADAAGRITVRHLLTMSSGIPTDGGGEAFRSTRSMSLEEAVRSLQSTHIAFEPGTKYEYVNANYAILGLLIETVTGQTYGDYLQQHIFTPLDMHHSYTDPELARQAGFADGYRYWFGRPVAYEMEYLPQLVPAGYIISTAEDLSRYLTMLLNNGTYNGQTLLSPEGIAELHKPGFEIPVGEWAKGSSMRYAMGWLVGGPWGEEPTIFHPGSAPSFTATLHLKPDQQLAVVTLINASNFIPLPGAQDELRQIPRGVMDLLTGQEPATSAGLNRFYLIFNLVVLAVVVLQLWALARLVRRQFTLELRPLTARRAWTVARQTVPLVWELVLGAVILTLPTMLHSWPYLWVWTPDLAVVFLVVGTLWVVTGLLRLAKLGTVLFHQRSRVQQTTFTPHPDVRSPGHASTH